MEEEKDIYTEEGTEDYIEGDEISSEEQGFMLGYLEAWLKCFLKESLLIGKTTWQDWNFWKILISSKA